MALKTFLWLSLWLGVVLAIATSVVAGSAPGRLASRMMLGAEAVWLAVTTAALIAYIAGDDAYRDNGISRWDAYDAHALTIAAVGLGAAAIVAVGFALVRRHSARAALVAGLVAVVASVLQLAAFIANTVN